MTTLLLAYYHPVVFDLVISFRKLFSNVEMCVTKDLKDNYGTHEDVIKRATEMGILCQTSNVAAMKMGRGYFDIVGVDGLFQGDELLIDVCKAFKVPYFAINGYPHNFDEPAENILSFSWFLPQARYRSKYPHEAHVKQLNWSEIKQHGQSTKQKNVCVFYPEFSELKRNASSIYSKNERKSSFLSLIHRFQECNENSFAVFEAVQRSLKEDEIVLENFSSLSQEQVWDKIHESAGLIHLKHADCPGISVLESMLLGRVPIVMKDFVLASQNQEVLIDQHSAIVCDSVDELVDRSVNHLKEIRRIGECYSVLEVSTMKHAYMLTDFDRQKKALSKFFDRCFKR